MHRKVYERISRPVHGNVSGQKVRNSGQKVRLDTAKTNTLIRNTHSHTLIQNQQLKKRAFILFGRIFFVLASEFRESVSLS